MGCPRISGRAGQPLPVRGKGSARVGRSLGLPPYRVFRSGLDMFVVGLGVAIVGYFVGDWIAAFLQ